MRFFVDLEYMKTKLEFFQAGCGQMVFYLVFGFVMLQISNSCRPLVRKKAALCLLRLFRKNPDVVNIDGW